MNWVIDQDQLHITIGSSPQDQILNQELNLETELGMIKAALLYADHSTLCSPTASVFSAMLDMSAHISTGEKLAFFESLPTWFPNSEIATQAQQLKEFHDRAWSRRYSKKGAESLRLFERALSESWPIISEGLREAITKLGGDEVVSAAESGFLDIHKFRAPIERVIVDAERRSFVLEYVSVLAGTISGKSTYPLFDEESNSIISAGIKAGIIPVSDLGIARGKEVGLAADLFKRLPLFPRASVNEILDIRRELDGPLRQFRSAMLRFSGNIKNASWDEEFDQSAELVFRQEVAPAILNIEAEVKSNRFMMELTERLVPVGAAGVSVLAVAMSNLPSSALAALALGGATVASGTLVQAYRAYVKKRQEIEQNNLFFYYKASQLLLDGTYEYHR